MAGFADVAAGPADTSTGRVWAMRIADLAANLIGSREELVGRYLATIVGVFLLFWLVRSDWLFGWLLAFVIGQGAMFGWILTRDRSVATRADYGIALASCALNAALFIVLPFGLWVEGAPMGQLGAFFFVIGLAIYGLTRNGTVRALAIIDAVPVLGISLYIAVDFTRSHLSEVNVAAPLLMSCIILGYYVLSLRENFVTRHRLRLAEERAVEAARHKVVARLTAGVAHDFNNILTAVLGHLDLHDALNDPAEKTECVRAAHEAASRAARLTAQLTFFAGQARLDTRQTDLAAFLGSFATRARDLLPTGIALHTNLAEGVSPVMVDCVKLDHMLVQLVLNAADSMPDGGTATLSLGQVKVTATRRLQGQTRLMTGDYCVISLEDEGVGIGAADLAQVCEPFFSTKRSGRASGLGLAMVAGFVAQSGGALDIASKPGHGTVVRVYLPAIAGATTAPVEAQAPSA